MLIVAKIPKLLLCLMCRGGRVRQGEGVSRCIDNRELVAECCRAAFSATHRGVARLVTELLFSLLAALLSRKRLNAARRGEKKEGSWDEVPV